MGQTAAGGRQPRNLWLIARTYLLAEHESILEEALLCISALDFEYLRRYFLGIQELKAPDVLMLKLCHPDLVFIEDDEGQSLAEGDHGTLEAVEVTLGSIGSHLAVARLIIADFAIRNSETFDSLERRMAEWPDIFQAGLQLLSGQTCLRGAGNGPP